MKDTLEKGTMSKTGFVPFTPGLIINSRENASLQNDLKSDSKWYGSSEKGTVASIESGEEKFKGSGI